MSESGTHAREVRAAVGRRKGGADNLISSLAGSGGALSTPAIAFVSACAEALGVYVAIGRRVGDVPV